MAAWQHHHVIMAVKYIEDSVSHHERNANKRGINMAHGNQCSSDNGLLHGVKVRKNNINARRQRNDSKQNVASMALRIDISAAAFDNVRARAHGKQARITALARGIARRHNAIYRLSIVGLDVT